MKQAELPFDRPGELPLFGEPMLAPAPFTVPEFPLEAETVSAPEPEPASAPAPLGRRRSKRPLYLVPCEGPDATGCPRPGCPGDAVRTVVYRPDVAPIVRTLCHWCWMAERDAYPLPCSACGTVAEYVKHFSRWWHLSGRNGLMDACGDCLRPLPGACMDCTGSDSWLTLCNGEFPDFPGDCTCWRATAERRPLAATVPEVLEILKQRAQAQADALPGQKSLFNPRAEIINRYSTSQEQRDEASEELTNDDMASHLAGLHDQMQDEIDHAPEGSERKREAILARDQARADLEELLLFGGDTESES